MVDPSRFTDDENWRGGYYELALKLPPVDDEADRRLLDAVTAMWDDPTLEGCYLDRWSEPDAQPRVAPLLDPIDHPSALRGIATLPNGPRVVCSTIVVRTDAHGDEPREDWLYLALPLGALARADERVGGYPFEPVDTSRAWREPIDAWLIAVAHRVHARSPFALGQIAFEVAGMDDFDGEAADHEGVTFLDPSPSGLRVLPPKPWS